MIACSFDFIEIAGDKLESSGWISLSFCLLFEYNVEQRLDINEVAIDPFLVMNVSNLNQL